MPRTKLDLLYCLEGAYGDLLQAGSNEKACEEVNAYIQELLSELKNFTKKGIQATIDGNAVSIGAKFPQRGLQVRASI